MYSVKRLFTTPGRLIIVAVIATIIVGSLLLLIPGAQRIPIGFWDLVFTATSAASVTGHMTVPLEAFTRFGQLLLVLLIQIGGLGIITLSLFFISFVIDLGLGAQFLAGQVLELDNIRGIRNMIKFIIFFTLATELLGMIIMFFVLPSFLALEDRIFYSIAHTVSSFCNAGFVFIPAGIIPFKTDLPFLLVTSFLVLIGSFGFITWHELFKYTRSYHKKKHFHLSLHTTLVLTSTLIIILVACILLGLLEYRHSFADLPPLTALVNIFFNAICIRSTGFSTLDMNTIQLSTLFVIMIISFIGSSPGSTGSGIKTTTFAIFLATIRAVILGKSTVELQGRTIPKDQAFKAMTVFSLSLSWIALGIFALLITEVDWNFIDVVFETFSAFDNLGLSRGMTPYLSSAGKLLTGIIMIIGRIGSLTLLLALKRRGDSPDFHYPEEKVMLS